MICLIRMIRSLQALMMILGSVRAAFRTSAFRIQTSSSPSLATTMMPPPRVSNTALFQRPSDDDLSQSVNSMLGMFLGRASKMSDDDDDDIINYSAEREPESPGNNVGEHYDDQHTHIPPDDPGAIAIKAMKSSTRTISPRSLYKGVPASTLLNTAARRAADGVVVSSDVNRDGSFDEGAKDPSDSSIPGSSSTPALLGGSLGEDDRASARTLAIKNGQLGLKSESGGSHKYENKMEGGGAVSSDTAASEKKSRDVYKGVPASPLLNTAARRTADAVPSNPSVTNESGRDDVVQPLGTAPGRSSASSLLGGSLGEDDLTSARTLAIKNNQLEVKSEGDSNLVGEGDDLYKSVPASPLLNTAARRIADSVPDNPSTMPNVPVDEEQQPDIPGRSAVREDGLLGGFLGGNEDSEAAKSGKVLYEGIPASPLLNTAARRDTDGESLSKPKTVLSDVKELPESKAAVVDEDSETQWSEGEEIAADAEPDTSASVEKPTVSIPSSSPVGSRALSTTTTSTARTESYLGNPTISATALAHSQWSHVIRPNIDTVIDATCGNGNDSEALAKMLFQNSEQQSATAPQLLCIDIQESACKKTRERLEELLPKDTMEEYVDIVESSHAPLPVPRDMSSVGLVCYNLGYLPKSFQKDLHTKMETTTASVAHAALLLRVGGMLSVTAYPRTNPNEDYAVYSLLEGMALFTSDEMDWREYPEQLGPDVVLTSRLTDSYEPTFQVRESVRSALELIHKHGAPNQTWRVMEYKLLGRAMSPVLLTATRIK